MALPLDELELISKKLTFAPDYIRFRSICKAWRAAAPKHAPLPWLIATAPNCTKFYQFCFKANKFTQIPELSGPSLLSSFLDQKHVFIRSSHGWLFSVDLHTKSGSLVNPLTDSRINLPKLGFMEYSRGKHYMESHEIGFVLTSDPSESLPDCFAVVYYGGGIYHCKVGSCSGWREMQRPEINRGGHIHMCCYRGKVFLALGADVSVCEFGDNPSICKLVSLGLNPLPLQETYLVESDGDLLLVLVSDICYSSCKVFKLEFGQQQVKLVELKCLGDRSLFVGLDTTFSLLASKYPGCKKNSIYIPEFSGRFDQPTIIPALIIYDCEEEQPRCIPDIVEDPGNLILVPCTWFTPSLLI